MVVKKAETPIWLTWIDRVNVAAAVLGGLATVILMLQVVADVASRYLFNRPLDGTLEITQFVWMPTLVSLGLGYALLRGEHIRVNLLTAPTSSQTQRVVEIVGMSFTLFMTGVLIYFGAVKAQESLGETAMTISWLAITPFRWIVTIGLVVFFLQALATLIRAVRVEEFVPNDADEVAAAIEAEVPVFDGLQDTTAKNTNVGPR